MRRRTPFRHAVALVCLVVAAVATASSRAAEPCDRLLASSPQTEKVIAQLAGLKSDIRAAGSRERSVARALQDAYDRKLVELARSTGLKRAALESRVQAYAHSLDEDRGGEADRKKETTDALRNKAVRASLSDHFQYQIIETRPFPSPLKNPKLSRTGRYVFDSADESMKEPGSKTIYEWRDGRWETLSTQPYGASFVYPSYEDSIYATVEISQGNVITNKYTFRVRDVSGKELLTYAGDADHPTNVAFDPTSKRVAIADWRGPKIFDLTSVNPNVPVIEIERPDAQYRPLHIEFSGDGKSLLYFYQNNTSEVVLRSLDLQQRRWGSDKPLGPSTTRQFPLFAVNPQSTLAICTNNQYAAQRTTTLIPLDGRTYRWQKIEWTNYRPFFNRDGQRLLYVSQTSDGTPYGVKPVLRTFDPSTWEEVGTAMPLDKSFTESGLDLIELPDTDGPAVKDETLMIAAPTGVSILKKSSPEEADEAP